MKRKIKLWTSAGRRLRIVLENWGSGVDNTHRRWTLGDGYWECMDSGEVAQKTRSSGPEALDSGNPGAQASPEATDRGLGESVAPDATITPPRGQTMVEYALIIAAVSVVAWGAYNLMGHDIVSMASGVDSSLTST